MTALRKDVPRDLETIILKAADTEPSCRYDTAADLAEDLNRFASGHTIRARRATHRETTRRWIVRKPPDSKEAANLTERFRIVELVDGGSYDMSQDSFRFMLEPGVDPTNNHSEQQVRPCVIDRRITQGTRSESEMS